MSKLRMILLLAGLMLIGFLNAGAQSIKNYEADWKRIDVLINERDLPKTALEEVRKIYVKAKKEKQDAQVIKALVFITSLQQQTRESNEVLSIKELEKEILSSKEPSTSILKSLLATQYWQYFQRNRWKLYNRTNTTGFVKDDIDTWTIEDFHKKISALYLQSIKNDALLKKTNIEAYNAIIIKGNARNLRPTLFDLLAHQALDYFEGSERDIKKPAYAFEITQPDAFAPAAEFAKTSFITKDSLSLQHKALLVYQQLLAFHLGDKSTDALIDADLQRLHFVYTNATIENKDELYVAALNHIISQYSNAQTAQAKYLLAHYYENLASQYQPLVDTTNRYARIKAKEILETVVKDSSVKNEGWVNSYNLLNSINRISFSFEIEKVNIPGQPFRSLVTYKNIPQLFFRLVALNKNLKDRLPNIYDKYWSTLTALPALKIWQQTLPQTADLQQHSVEIKFDALPVGEYILLASADDKFNSSKSLLGMQSFYVSNISYINQGNTFFILNRESGQPLEAAEVKAFFQQYNYKTSKYEQVPIGAFKADKNGLVNIEQKKTRNESIYLNISYKGDSLNISESLYPYYRSNDEKEKVDTLTSIFYFTDRSIYRPGQTIYFKGIVVNKWKKEANIISNFTTKVFLRDANYEDVDSITVTTNEFGSFNGKFKLPQNVLNGAFTIYDKETDNETSFSVEEYKRPKFQVSFEKIKDSYKVNDSIHVTGKAVAYAGNVTDGAKVSYRVVRQARFLYPWLVKIWPPRIQQMEIAHGETKTDAEGKFNVTFKAIPDAKLDKKFDPFFDYRLIADVTDINGETRSAETIISAGYKSLLIETDIPEKINPDSLKTLSIRTENMNGEHQPSVVNITITKLIPENRLVRNRYWEQPDQFIMTKQEYISFFPYDEYKDESDLKTWQKGETIYTSTDSTNANGIVDLHKELPAGFYTIEITTKDKEGAEVKSIVYTEVLASKSKNLNKPEYLWTNEKSEATQPGEKAAIEVGSSAKDVFLIQQVDKEKTADFQFSKLNNEKKTFEYAVAESDKGGFGVAYIFVKHNRIYNSSHVINVPWNKDLNIEYTTFRDKTLPGSEEKWSVKISGAKGEKVAAEMLASMYDASLDQFRMHKWTKPSLWPVYYSGFTWNGSQNFASVQSQQKWNSDIIYKSFSKQYDQFIFNNSLGYVVMPTSVKSRNMAAKAERVAVDSAAPAMAQKEQPQGKAAGLNIDQDAQLQEVVVTGYDQQKGFQNVGGEIQIRKNLTETAFFFPELRTDKDGNISFSFTAPEALTRWKLQTLAHTKDLSFGLSQKELVTQKQLMVQPNMPRFLRQGDRMEVSVKIANLSGKELTGQAQLELFDAATNQSVDGWFQNVFPNQYFTVAAGQSESVKFPIEVPYLFNSALVWRVVARAENFSDGEESTLPVLTNKVLVTETLPITMKGSGTKNFTFDKLLKANSETLQHQALTVEFTSNPAWYAVQALPYLAEQPTENAEQTWNRFYANALASTIINSAPRIKQIFEQWKNVDTSVLLSNLQKNEELKSALLEETPWVLAAKTEEQQKKNLAILFDMVRISSELKSNIEKLKAMQTEGGGFVWLKGAPEDRYMTQYIATGIGRLKKLNAVPKEAMNDLNDIASAAIGYLDKKIQEDYARLIKYKADLKAQHIGYMQIQYLYMRSFFKNIAIPKTTATAYNYYRKQSQQFWQKQSKYMSGMTAISLHRTGDTQTPKDILRSLKETSITSDELGMYWKDNSYGISWYWWHAPIETQSLLIETFSEVGNDTNAVDDMKTWLLKNKQTNNWRTTKATADACYAMLLQGTNWLSNEPHVNIQLGSMNIAGTQQKAEAGTGYFKKTIEGTFVQPAMGKISVTVQQPAAPVANTTSWGAVYWQYFEDMDKVTSASTPLQLNKKLFVERVGDRGPILTPVNDGDALKVGDKIKVRVELRVDRDMEYVHMKDLRASALEPVNVISGYRWQGGLGYYETTKDVSTSFYFNYLPKGTYVFEYPLFVTHAGNFSNGITTIQCLYAPEFAAHSEGVRINVE